MYIYGGGGDIHKCFKQFVPSSLFTCSSVKVGEVGVAMGGGESHMVLRQTEVAYVPKKDNGEHQE